MNDIYQQFKLKSTQQICLSNLKKDFESPPFSRLFVIYPKRATTQELQATFEQYGPIEDTWIVREKETCQAKGIAYIKYTRTSHAARALEELNGKCLSGHFEKPLRVIISNEKDDTRAHLAAGSLGQENTIDLEKMQRLFVVIPKEFKKKDLRDSFRPFGDIENVQIIFNKNTNENKGFGYVRFYRASDAARALEECDPMFKPKFAEPYSVKLAREREICIAREMMSNSSKSSTSTNTSSSSSSSSSSSTDSSLFSLDSDSHKSANLLTSSLQQLAITSESKLLVKCFTSVQSQFVHRLFDLIPGLVDFQELPDPTLALIRQEVFYLVTYESKEMASHALRKLNKFPGPCGETLAIYDLDNLLQQTIFN